MLDKGFIDFGFARSSVLYIQWQTMSPEYISGPILGPHSVENALSITYKGTTDNSALVVAIVESDWKMQ